MFFLNPASNLDGSRDPSLTFGIQKFSYLKKVFYTKSHSKTPKCPRNTKRINAVAISAVAMGPTLIPIEESSKNRIKPAPPIGMGAFPDLLFLRLD